MFNGPAIKNRIASYGYAGELSWSMGPKMAAAVSLRREHLRPSDPVLDTAFTDLSLQRGAPVDTLKPNTLSTFYAYIYRRLTTFFYLGYAFSRLDAAFDGVALTDAQGPIPPLPQYETTFAMYPYPTLNELISHTASITLLFNPVSSITWTSKASVPFYSAQKVYAFPDTLMTHHFDDQDEVKYGYKLEFAAPLTIGTTVDYNVRNNLTVSFTYDCFGFPYEEWAYFTKNSYSLHTFKLRITQRL
jgi:hypothetical protein